MKAVVCREFGAPDRLSLEEVPSPRPGPEQIVVSIKAAGVNFPDVLMIQGKYQRTLPFPFTPGMEAAGVVKEVGSEIAEFSVGDRVCVHARMGGAFAEELAVSANYAVARIPDAVDYPSAAAFPLAYGTALEALKDRAQLQPGETVLVLGAAGGVGMAAVQLAKILGARVIACASSDERLETCRAHGADHLVNYESQDLRDAIRSLTNDRGVDVICDQIGGRYAEPALRGMAINGRYCVVGFASGSIPKIPLNLVLLKGCSIVGVAIGMNAVRGNPSQYRSNLMQLIEWIACGRLRPVVTAKYPLAKSQDALNDVLNRRIQGKAVIIP